MKNTPEFIYLTPDDEDPSCIVWTNDQPDADKGIEYIRKDVVAEAAETDRQIHEAEILKLTRLLDEHPEDWDGPCECSTCMSYAENDG